MRRSWEEGVGVGWVGKRSSDCRSMDDMLNYRSFSVLKGTVVWSRYTRGGSISRYDDMTNDHSCAIIAHSSLKCINNKFS